MSITKTVSHRLKWLVLRWSPETVMKRVAPRYVPEAEVALLPVLCDRKRLSIDVGASGGIYTFYLLAFSRSCLSFEPRPSVAARLEQKLAFAGNRARVHAVALSDRRGEALLRVPCGEAGRATIEDGNALAGVERVEQVKVPTRQLDEFATSGVGFIKIDVEGHELAVLRGARACLLASRPRLLVEIEDRHHPDGLRHIREYLGGLGYQGFFLWDHAVRALAEFNPLVHQDPLRVPTGVGAERGEYVQNFIFVHEDDRSIIKMILKGREQKGGR